MTKKQRCPQGPTDLISAGISFVDSDQMIKPGGNHAFNLQGVGAENKTMGSGVLTHAGQQPGNKKKHSYVSEQMLIALHTSGLKGQVSLQVWMGCLWQPTQHKKENIHSFIQTEIPLMEERTLYTTMDPKRSQPKTKWRQPANKTALAWPMPSC